MSEELRRVGFRTTPELKQRVDNYAKENGVIKEVFYKRAIENYLDKLENKTAV